MPQPHAGDVLFSPRVLDERSAGELAASLRDVIREAEAAGESLGRQVETLGALRPEAAETARYLQDRLKVGARMLKAFEVHLRHVQGLLDALRETARRAERRVADLAEVRDAVERRLDEVMSGIEDRADAAMASVFARYVGQIEARERALGDLDDRLAGARDRAEAITRLVEGAEVNVAMLAHRSAAAAREAERIARTGPHGARGEESVTVEVKPPPKKKSPA